MGNQTKVKLINSVVSGIAQVSKLMSASKLALGQESIEAISILTYATVSATEKDKPAQSTAKKGRNEAESVDWSHNKIVLMESLKSISSSSAISRLYQTYADLENLVGYHKLCIGNYDPVVEYL